MCIKTKHKPIATLPKIIFLLYALVLCLPGQSQDQSVRNAGLVSHYGFIFAHSRDVENTAGSRPWGIGSEYSVLKFDSASFNHARCYPKTGFGLIYFNYDNAILGHSVTGLYFIEPSFAITQRILFAPRGSVGLSYLTNPYHPVKNPDNNSYSLPVSVFLQVGVVLSCNVTKKLQLNAGAHYLHISNGGIKDPNKGINWPTVQLGLHYQLNNAAFEKQTYVPSRSFDKRNKIEAGISFTGRYVAKGEKQLYPVAGVFVGYYRRLNNLHSVGVIADFHLDYSLAEAQRRINESLYFHFLSLALGHEFLMGRFTFWQQAGYYILPADERYCNWYHRWGLDYSLTDKVSVGGSLKAHLHVAHFMDVRVAYRFYY